MNTLEQKIFDAGNWLWEKLEALKLDEAACEAKCFEMGQRCFSRPVLSGEKQPQQVAEEVLQEASAGLGSQVSA